LTKGLPKVGKKVKLPEGTGKIRNIDFFSGTITIDIPEEKDSIVMSLDEFREKLK
jgi:cell fate regulator YaaT (PSP1 superfamily)